MSDVWSWLIFIATSKEGFWLLFILASTVFYGIYIVRYPASPSQKKYGALFIFDLFILPFIVIAVVDLLPTNALYELTLASIPLLALGILLIYVLFKSIGAATQAQDEAQSPALFFRFLLILPLLYFAPICIFLLVQRSPHLQNSRDLLFTPFSAEKRPRLEKKRPDRSPDCLNKGTSCSCRLLLHQEQPLRRAIQDHGYRSLIQTFPYIFRMTAA